jgi:hypothetical protein
MFIALLTVLIGAGWFISDRLEQIRIELLRFNRREEAKEEKSKDHLKVIQLERIRMELLRFNLREEAKEKEAGGQVPRSSAPRNHPEP